MIIAAISWELHLPGLGSLKEKRSVVSRIKSRLQHEFRVSVAETDHHDVWQRAELTACLVSVERRHAESVLDSLDRYVAEADGCRVIDTVRTFY